MKKYLIHTYGCQMNVHESEKIAGILMDEGFEATARETDADITPAVYAKPPKPKSWGT